MLIMVLRKMINNKWMVLCLLFGFVLAVAMVSSIPLYTDGVLQRMLIRDLENYQVSSGNFPGRYHVKANIYSNFEKNSRIKAFRFFDEKITNDVKKEIRLPVKAYTRNIVIEYLHAVPEVQREEKPMRRSMTLETLHGLEDHIKIVKGRMYSSEKKDGVYEVIVNESTMKELDLRLDEVYLVHDSVDRIDYPLKVKVVGIFTIKDSNDPYWFRGLYSYNNSFLMDESLFVEEFINGELNMITEAHWYYAFDYHKINLENTPKIIEAYNEHKRLFGEHRVDFSMPAIPVLERYYNREQQLKITLWVVQVPILVMLGFYLLMVSRLIIEQEQNEIAVLKSRGASSSQVFFGYLIEGLVLGGIALLVGPPLGLFICSLLGASNGFLEFVQRTALPLSLNKRAYLYSLAAVVLAIVTMLIPAFNSSRITIVEHKRNKARSAKKPLWEKFFLDILLLAISIYGLYSYKLRQQHLETTGASGVELAIDPMLFLISTLFILGVGLVLLRIYPYVIRLIFAVGKKIWPPVLYASFVQVGRAGGQDRFLMLFLILSLATGIFNANAARTLNSNIEEKIRYANGADLNIMGVWETNEPKFSPAGLPPEMGGSTESSSPSREPVQYREPPFSPFTELDGIEMATKVFRKEEIEVQTPSRDWVLGRTELLGIIPDEFGKVAWFRDDLLKTHWYHYLNLLSSGDPRAALVSRDLQENYDIKKGDSLWLSWGEQRSLEVIVYEFIDYWPTFNPNAKEEERYEPSLIVAQLDYIQANNALEPYEVWLKKEPGATSKQVYEDIEEKEIRIFSITDTSQEIIKAKNDPMLQGTNGALTLGFVVTMSISIIGFLIYWILSIRQRVLQFGIFRAIGLSVKKVMGMLAWEQLLISGTAILIGIVVGGLASDLFVPLLQIVYSAAEQIPPFRVMASRQDYIKIYSVVAFMLTIGIGVLSIIISKIKIHQAIKLGED